MSQITENVHRLLNEIPKTVSLIAVIKTRGPDEVREAVDAGVRLLGGNYVQETAALLKGLDRTVPCHLIGHLQTNKVRKAVGLFDVIETVDSENLAREIDRRTGESGRGPLRVLIEINSGRETGKTGVFPEAADALAAAVSALPNLRLAGLMTMGSFESDPEDSRRYFRETRRVFERLSKALPRKDGETGMTVLSMGMSHSYKVAIDEGATEIRIGTLLFGPRA
ncbi:MAG: YggS family pyridoxal phosphate-dependent enzyme [bacterium]|nr:YggS family pyridoxal phosphate-dependent enzyme [bacterium]